MSGNPNPDYFVTVHDCELVETWAVAHGLTLSAALEAGVCADDREAKLYVPLELWTYVRN